MSLEIGLIVARGFGMNKTDSRVANRLGMIQPLSARVIGSWLTRTEHRARRTTHIPRKMPIDSVRLTVCVEASKASIGQRNFGEVIVYDSHNRTAHDTRKTNTDTDALNAYSSVSV